MQPHSQWSTEVMSGLPKAEIHLHLEGCLETSDLVRWARDAGVPLPRPEEELTRFDGLSSFLAYLDWGCGLINQPELLAQQAYSLAQRLHKDGTLYADVIFNPTHWAAWKSRLPAMIDALDAGFREARADGLPDVGLCVSLLRQQSAQEALELCELLVSLKHPRVVPLSVDGNEVKSGRTGTKFAQAFRHAVNAGLGRTVHAGESSGPEGIWDAINLLHANRIDHGVRAVEDPHLMDYLAQHAIPLGVCPSSNITLGLYPHLSDHPIDQLLQYGIKVSINTDDPVPLHTTLSEEYSLCAKTFAWNETILRQIAETSIQASFADTATKQRMLRDLDVWQAPSPDN